jgi:hypothetical protein
MLLLLLLPRFQHPWLHCLLLLLLLPLLLLLQAVEVAASLPAAELLL